MKTLAALLLFAALVGGCPQRTSVPEPTPESTPEAAAEPAVDRATCCAQCLDGARTDPAGMDLSLEPCSGYATHLHNGQRVMTDGCAAWFGEHRLMVQDCRL